MSKYALSAIETEMANFDFSELDAQLSKSRSNALTAKSGAEVRSEICQVWAKIRKYVILAESIPFIGKFIKILADLLDSLCPA